MIEIAICLAVIGFALAAIVGVLPLGMNVQRENREETVVNQDASVIIDAIRNGQLGLDDLTNYVLAITNYETDYTAGKPTSHTYGYTSTNSSQNGTLMSPTYPITNGFRIIGLLSTPRYTDTVVTPLRTTFRSNYVVALIRSLSGDASEKFPQTNATMNDLAFTYRMISDIVPYSDFDRSWTNYNNDPLIVGNTNEINARSNYFFVARTIQTNLYDLRLIFRYPYLPNGRTGNGRLVYRTSASGRLLSTNENGLLSTPYRLYYFEPRTYVKATP